MGPSSGSGIRGWRGAGNKRAVGGRRDKREAGDVVGKGKTGWGEHEVGGANVFMCVCVWRGYIFKY